MPSTPQTMVSRMLRAACEMAALVIFLAGLFSAAAWWMAD